MPTTSPTMAMTSTTACAPDCSTLDELAEAPLAGDMLAEMRAALSAARAGAPHHELVRRVITALVEDVIGESRAGSAELTPERRRRAPGGRSRWSASRQPMAAAERAIKSFLFADMYRHENVMRVWARPKAICATCSRAIPADAAATCRPNGARRLDRGRCARPARRRVADFIAGMTDRYALSEHQRLFDATPDFCVRPAARNAGARLAARVKHMNDFADLLELFALRIDSGATMT